MRLLDNLDKINGNFVPTITIGAKSKDVDDAMKKVEVPVGAKTCVISFAYDGTLPGTAKVTLDMRQYGYTNGETVYLYYYNPSTKEMEEAGNGIYLDGLVTFEMTHCSEYITTNSFAWYFNYFCANI